MTTGKQLGAYDYKTRAERLERDLAAARGELDALYALLKSRHPFFSGQRIAGFRRMAQKEARYATYSV